MIMIPILFVFHTWTVPCFVFMCDFIFMCNQIVSCFYCLATSTQCEKSVIKILNQIFKFLTSGTEKYPKLFGFFAQLICIACFCLMKMYSFQYNSVTCFVLELKTTLLLFEHLIYEKFTRSKQFKWQIFCRKSCASTGVLNIRRFWAKKDKKSRNSSFLLA